MRKMSAKTILGVIRWNNSVKTKGGNFKLDDAFTSRYAWKFRDEYPDYAFIFNYRAKKNTQDHY